MELMCVRFVRQNFLRSLPTNSQAFILKSLRWYCVGRGELQKCCRPTPCLESVHGSRSIRVFGKKNKTCQPSRELTSPNQCLNARTSLNTFGSHRLKGNFNIVSTVTLPKQFFHTSGRLQALPAPLLWLVLKPIQKLLAIILGRSLRKWWIALPPNKQQLLRETAWRRRWHLAAGAAGLLVVMAIFLLTHLDESPVTGRTRLLVFSRENFLELANLTAEQHMEEFKDIIISPKDPRHQVVERVVQHLAERNQDIAEISTVPWSVHVVDSPTMNAFVLPNGKVFIFTGMLEAVADIHQLTFILGHEMAHALIGHSAEQASMSHVVDFLSLILLTAIWAVCPRDSLAALGHWIQGKLVQFMFDRPYSRKLEAEADQVGLQLAAKACADVRAGPVFWQQMEISDQLRGESTVPEWLSTHPSHRNRVNQLDRLIPQALELRASCDCPALPATDPRAVFSESVRQLLNSVKERESAEKAKEKEGKLSIASGGGGIFLPLPHAPSPLAPGPPGQLGGVLSPTPVLSQALPSK
ncbi:hypothetical protein AALO_G00123120 [Alosa alosa]|uniref:Metalloendopeptidase OMA1, mitochondrial n=2 Tax=Alosa alosa TaxID=278164 RepID=A0AAV6GKB1_9TELE|nr:hypothetical protein AALO_G00123120 [Alosa alosa]